MLTTLLLFVSLVANAGDPQHFGAEFTVAKATPAAEMLPSPAEQAGKTVRVEGKLTQVCQKMGCWLVVADDAGNSMRVTMKDHAFGVAKDSAGKHCDVEGTVVAKEVDEKREAHFESEGAGPRPTTTYELVATAVRITDS